MQVHTYIYLQTQAALLNSTATAQCQDIGKGIQKEASQEEQEEGKCVRRVVTRGVLQLYVSM